MANDDVIEDRTKHEFYVELTNLVNRFSRENGSGTPDYIVANYLVDCLDNFNKSIKLRENWYGREQDPRFGTPVKGITPNG